MTDRAAIDDTEDWVGRVEEAEDSVGLHRVLALAATLDHAPEGRAGMGLDLGGVLPPLWHWLAFLPLVEQSRLDRDGHPLRGGFLPPVPLERRMWAGGRLQFHAPIRIGEALHRRSEILKVSEKSGAAGRMVFVTVGHRLSTSRGLAVSEEQDIVYAAMPDRFAPPSPVPPLPNPEWAEDVVIDTVRLFRFSAVTFNAHRIHFDRDYAHMVEKYPGLVVHGPLQAILLMEAARRHRGAGPVTFQFRGIRPMFDFDRPRLLGYAVEGAEQSLCTATVDGAVCMQARVGW
jgi:3-methylfumaryl-CoA hydratase